MAEFAFSCRLARGSFATTIRASRYRHLVVEKSRHPSWITPTSRLWTADKSFGFPSSFVHSVAVPAVTFDPVLNGPALGAFLVVVVIFGSLQWRIMSIERAVQRRMVALDTLRETKSKQLVGEASTDQVERAVQAYQNWYNEVENLRTVLPGVRIISPPSPSGNQQRTDDNVAGARQFLGIDPELKGKSNDLKRPSVANSNRPVEDSSSRMPFALTAVLAIVALSQIGLLFLFAQDPMSGGI